MRLRTGHAMGGPVPPGAGTTRPWRGSTTHPAAVGYVGGYTVDAELLTTALAGAAS
jgi:hypothetical protein